MISPTVSRRPLFFHAPQMSLTKGLPTCKNCGLSAAESSFQNVAYTNGDAQTGGFLNGRVWTWGTCVDREACRRRLEKKLVK